MKYFIFTLIKQVTESGQPVVTGRVRVPEKIENEFIELPVLKAPKGEDSIVLNEKDIYKELRLRGYNYR